MKSIRFLLEVMLSLRGFVITIAFDCKTINYSIRCQCNCYGASLSSETFTPSLHIHTYNVYIYINFFCYHWEIEKMELDLKWSARTAAFGRERWQIHSAPLPAVALVGFVEEAQLDGALAFGAIWVVLGEHGIHEAALAAREHHRGRLRPASIHSCERRSERVIKWTVWEFIINKMEKKTPPKNQKNKMYVGCTGYGILQCI